MVPKTVDRKRYYLTHDGDMYPSITTVLSVRNKQGLMEWRKRVGNEVANYVAGKAAARGTAVHHMCEDYLNNKYTNFPTEWEKHKKNNVEQHENKANMKGEPMQNIYGTLRKVRQETKEN